MRIIKQVLFWIAALFLSLVIVYNLTCMAARTLFGVRYPQVFGFSSASVLSGSMEPVIARGDVVFLLKDESYVRGEPAAYLDDNGTMVIHRIIEVREDGYIFKGDANDVADSEIVKPDQVRGRVIAILPGIGNLNRLFHSGTSLIGIGITVSFALYLGVGFIAGINRRKSRAGSLG